jgi:hypothetical protein
VRTVVSDYRNGTACSLFSPTAAERRSQAVAGDDVSAQLVVHGSLPRTEASQDQPIACRAAQIHAQRWPGHHLAAVDQPEEMHVLAVVKHLAARRARRRSNSGDAGSVRPRPCRHGQQAG